MNAPVSPEVLVIDRSKFLGGSDAAAILGVSPWATPLDIYLEKTGQVVREIDPAREKLFKRGKRLEPVVVDMLIEDLGVKVTKRSTPAQPNRYVDPEHDFLAVEIDFEWEVTRDVADLWGLDLDLVGTIQNGEVKTVHHFAAGKFGEVGTDEVPIEYAAQAMQGLGLTGRKVTLFGVLEGADNLTTYIVKRDGDTVTKMRTRLVRFWNENVLAGVAPEPVNLPDVLTLFHRVPTIKVEANEEAIKQLEAFEAAKSAARVAEEAVEEAKYQLGKFMLGAAAIDRPVGPRGGKKGIEPTPETRAEPHELLIGGAPALVINLQKQTRLDNDKVRSDYPEVAIACSKQIKFFRFDPPRKKKAA